MAKKQDDRKLQITFNPQFSAAEQKTILLREPQTVAVGNAMRTEQVPIIPGLPTEFTIKKGEIKEVTLEQFKALYELGYIDTPEDIAKRKRDINAVADQAGVNRREYKMAGTLSHLYVENFTLVE